MKKHLNQSLRSKAVNSVLFIEYRGYDGPFEQQLEGKLDELKIKVVNWSAINGRSCLRVEGKINNKSIDQIKHFCNGKKQVIVESLE
jgi:hypothetical protein